MDRNEIAESNFIGNQGESHTKLSRWRKKTKTYQLNEKGLNNCRGFKTKKNDTKNISIDKPFDR